MMIQRLPLGDAKAAAEVVKMMDTPMHTVLRELGLYVFWGGHLWVGYERGMPVALTCGRIGKRKKNLWEPYLNWYGAFTVPSHRREGYATVLYRAMEAAAAEAGCRRVKSLAGSRAGLALHQALGHQCWGKTENCEVFVDSPLPGCMSLYKGMTPPQAPKDKPMTSIEFNNIIKEGLRYDKEA